MANETYDSIWDAIADSPEEAAALNAQSTLIHELLKLAHGHPEVLQQLGLSCGVSEASMSEIAGRLAKADIFDLFKLAPALGYRVDIRLVAMEK